MARMDGVPFLGIADNGVMSRWDIVCIHTIVGYQSGGNAAHFTTGANGHIVQARDTKYRSAANLNGNYRVIAIENEDHGVAYGAWSGSNVPAFTTDQCEAIAKICAWAHRMHDIPLAICPDSKSTSRGIAYHRQGIDGNFSSFAYGGRVTGGEIWSSSFGKVCPGDKRIRQLIEVIIPRAQQLAGLSKDTDMNLSELIDFRVKSPVDNGLRNIWDFEAQNEINIAALSTVVSEIRDKVEAITTGDVDLDVLADKVTERLLTKLNLKQV